MPSALADFLILRLLRESCGGALALGDHAMLDGVRELAETEGLFSPPEAAATLAGLKRLLADGFLSAYETIVLLLTASGYKYTEVLKTAPSAEDK